MSRAPRTFDEMAAHYGDDARVERVRKVAKGAALYVDAAAIQRDFGWVFGSRTPSDAMYADFVSEIAAVLSEPHFASTDVSTVARAAGGEATCLRPPRYGRAGVLDVRDFFTDARRPEHETALVDVKGLGVPYGTIPLRGFRSNGLLTIIEALQELINKEMLDAIFTAEGVDVRCNEIYGIALLGISGASIFFSDPVPCVTMLRRAHLRSPDNDELPRAGAPEDFAKRSIELLLRRYGVTSAPEKTALRVWEENGALRARHDGRDLLSRMPEDLIRYHFDKVGLSLPQMIRLINIQTTDAVSADPLSATLIDFGHYTVLPSFDHHHLLAPVRDAPMNWGHLFRNDAADWVQPDPARRVDLELLGKGRIEPQAVEAIPLEEIMIRTNDAGQVPGSVRIAAELTACWLNGTLAAGELGREAQRYARMAVRP